VLETKGECAIEGPKLEFGMYVNTLKMCKVNIGTKDNPKFTNIGYYWNEETIDNIVDLLREYQDISPTTFT
jgi:hypothetical protein